MTTDDFGGPRAAGIRGAGARAARGFEIGCGVLMTLITLVCFFQVVGRYLLFTQAIGWAEDVSRLCFVWGIFLGAAVAVQRQTHLGVDIVISRLPAGRLRTGVNLFRQLCMLVVAGILLYYGYQFAMRMAGDRLTTLGYSRNLFYLPAPVSGLLMLLWLAPQMLRNVRSLLASSSIPK